MPPTLALSGCALFVFWLFAKDSRRRGKISAALWIPLTWAFIISSKPVSVWLGMGSGLLDDGGAPQDQLIDKAIFLGLIAAGLFVLSRRRLDWRATVRNNKWLFVYFLYLGLSVLWSGESFVSLKRWIKDFGNVVMVLVILSEENPDEAIKAFFSRCAYLVVPLSVLVIRYYPQSSRHYDMWTNQPWFVGINTDKNAFGMAVFVCALSLFRTLLEFWERRRRDKARAELIGYTVLMMMAAWLLHMAQSATAITCTVLGSGIILSMKVPAVKKKVHQLGAYIATIAVTFMLIKVSGFDKFVVGQVAGLVGRDPSLHGRDAIWGLVLNEDINPLIGEGFYSFWSAERNARLSKNYYYPLGEAHNGYIEIYLNEGLIGVALLITVMGSSIRGIKRDILGGVDLGALRLAFLCTVAIYNVTESVFDRLGLMWFAFVLVLMEYPRVANAASSCSTTPQLQGTDAILTGRLDRGSADVPSSASAC